MDREIEVHMDWGGETRPIGVSVGARRVRVRPVPKLCKLVAKLPLGREMLQDVIRRELASTSLRLKH